MKLVITTLEAGNLKHTEVELAEQTLDISVELANGVIFQFTPTSDLEESLEIRETTYRKLAIEPKSSNTLTLKGI